MLDIGPDNWPCLLRQLLLLLLLPFDGGCWCTVGPGRDCILSVCSVYHRAITMNDIRYLNSVDAGLLCRAVPTAEPTAAVQNIAVGAVTLCSTRFYGISKAERIYAITPALSVSLSRTPFHCRYHIKVPSDRLRRTHYARIYVTILRINTCSKKL